MMLASIDPGVVCTGWALWARAHARFELVACGMSRRPTALAHAPLAQVCALHATNLQAALPPGLAYVVVEQQQLSKGRDSDAPFAKANDLLAVQAVGMLAAGRLGVGELIYPLVTDWLGSANEKITRNRIEGALDAREAAVWQRALTGKKIDHNLNDAVALGLWATSRYRSGHGFPPRLSLSA